MDKTEYKIRAEEIKSLIKAQRFADAVKIADTIDWKRVKSVGMLCAISDLYKVNRRLEESRDILLLAYDRSPTRREIVYSLCELAIAMGEFVQAVEYYKEFVRLAPRNTARYILQYKLYEAQEVSLEERIAVLEEYKKHDYNEKWAYELAYLYHRVGLTTECIEECDELFLYMREGRFVMKALELKSLHEPLSPEQKAAYQRYKAETGGTLNVPKMSQPVMGRDVKEGSKTPTKEIPQIPENFEAGELAATPTNEIPQDGLKDTYQNEQVASSVPERSEVEMSPADLYDQPTQDISFREDMIPSVQSQPEPVDQYVEAPHEKSIYEQDTQIWEAQQNIPESYGYAESDDQGVEEPVEEAPVNETVHIEYEVPTVNVGDYNTVDLQREIAKNLEEVLSDSPEAALFADAHGPQVVKEGDELLEPTGEMFDTTDTMDIPQQPTMSEVFYEDKKEETAAPAPDIKVEAKIDVNPEESDTPEVKAVSEEITKEIARPGRILEEIAKSEKAPAESAQPGKTSTESTESEETEEEIAEAQDIEEEEADPYVEPKAHTKPDQVRKTPLAEELNDKKIAASIAASTYNEYALYKGAVFTDEPLQDEVPGAVIKPNVRYKSKSNNHFEKMLSQESDGQISMAIDDEKQVERQITGQISIQDFMTDWESYKKNQQKKQLQNVKNKVASETGELFKDFDQNLLDPMMRGENTANTIKEVLMPGGVDPLQAMPTPAVNIPVAPVTVPVPQVNIPVPTPEPVPQVNIPVPAVEPAPEVSIPVSPAETGIQEPVAQYSTTETQPGLQELTAPTASAPQPGLQELTAAATPESQPGLQELTAPVAPEPQPELQELTAPVASEPQPELQELTESVTPAPQPTEDLREIKPVDDLQNTQSMVQISGEDLQYAEPFIEEEPREETGYVPTDEELAADYPDDEDLEAEEMKAAAAESNVAVEAPVYTTENNTEAADIDLGETTEIEATAVEDAVEAAMAAIPKAPAQSAGESFISHTTEGTATESAANQDYVGTAMPQDYAEPEAEAFAEPEAETPAEPEAEESTETETTRAPRRPVRATKKEEPQTSEKEEREMETRVRVMTPEEKELFGPYIHHRKSRKQIIEAIDNLSMAAYTNNAIVTGEEGAGTVNLAKGLIKAIQASDSNFSGKVAMISAITLNKRTVSTILEKIVNGALIIRRAADLKEDTVATLLKQLQNENKGYIVVIEDTKDDIDRLLDKYPMLKKCFNVRVDIEALDDDSLVAYAKQYALEKDHVIDNLGILALHQKISERQTLDHEVTVTEVKEMVDDAIYYADKASVGHVVDVLLRKRFDEEDMIILREKDFLH